MTSLAAILVRDMRIAIRVGGGALMGVSEVPAAWVQRRLVIVAGAVA